MMTNDGNAVPVTQVHLLCELVVSLVLWVESEWKNCKNEGTSLLNWFNFYYVIWFCKNFIFFFFVAVIIKPHQYYMFKSTAKKYEELNGYRILQYAFMLFALYCMFNWKIRRKFFVYFGNPLLFLVSVLHLLSRECEWNAARDTVEQLLLYSR